MYKNKILRKIEELVPEKDHWEIVRLSVFYEFPWDFNRSLELALYKTFAVPSIAKILSGTGEFENHAQKRYDDTDIILSEIIEHGLDSERGREAVNRLNWIHSNYSITNNDYLYVLSTFVFDSGRWINKYSYRKLTDNEEQAGYKVWVEIGEAMGIKDIPDTLEKLRAFNINYEKEHFVYSDANRRVAQATENLMLSWYLPKLFWEIARPFLHAIMDEHLLKAFGYKNSPVIFRFLANNTLKLRGKIAGLFPRSTPFLRTSMFKHRAYPKGYELEDLGPEKLKKSCPYHAVMNAVKKEAI